MTANSTAPAIIYMCPHSGLNKIAQKEVAEGINEYY